MIELRLLTAMGVVGRRYDQFVSRPHAQRLWLIIGAGTVAFAWIGVRRGDLA